MSLPKSSFNIKNLLVLFGGGLAPSTKTVRSFLRTPCPAKKARIMDLVFSIVRQTQQLPLLLGEAFMFRLLILEQISFIFERY
jgi:hypothetical protein